MTETYRLVVEIFRLCRQAPLEFSKILEEGP